MLKNTGITIALAMLSMVGALGIDAYLPSFPAIIQDFQATPLAVQQTLSIYVGAMAITTLFAGTLSDSFGRRPPGIVSLLLFTAGSALAIFARDIQILLVARGLQGIAAGFGAVLSRTIVQDRFQGAEAQRVMALIMMVFSIAPSFAPVIGGWLQATFGWHSVFIMLTGYGLVLWLIWQLGIPETLPKAQRMPLQLGRIVGNYGKVLFHRVFILRVLSIALVFIGVAIYISSAAPYIINILGLSETSFAWMFIPMTLGMLGGSSTHNGLRDVTAHLGTPRYWRLRLGIGHPRSLNLNKSVVDFVLGKPSQSDQQLIDQAIDRSVDHLPILMRDGWEIATQQLHSADPAMQQAKAARKGSPEAKPTDSL